MIEELQKVLNDYTDKNFDIDFLNKIEKIYTNKMNIEKYVYCIKLLKEREALSVGNTCISTYNPINKEIAIYQKGIDYMLSRYKKYYHLFDKNEIIIFNNILVAVQLLHELEHARQRKLVKEKNDIETDLLKICLPDIIIEQAMQKYPTHNKQELEQSLLNKTHNNYQKYYTISPEERLAQIKSLQNIRLALKKYPNILEFISTLQLEAIINGYEYELGPTITYLQKTNNEKLLNKYDWYNNHPQLCLKNVKKEYSLKDRILYGLPIDLNEKNEIEENIMYSKKYGF